MKPFYFFLQDVLIKNITSFPKNENYIIFKNLTELSQTDVISSYISENNITPIMFCSIDNASFLIKNNSILAKSIILPQNPYDSGILDWHHYSSVIPENFLLNSSGLIFSFDNIMKNKKFIFDTIGEKIFIRPLSPWKPFTGFDTFPTDFEYDLNSYKTLSNIKSYELCLVAPFKEISNPEYRFWMIEGNIATFAPYSVLPAQTVHTVSPPTEMINMVKEISEILTIYDHCFVIDMCMTPTGPKMVELNGFSTSGWYIGMDIKELFDKIKTQYLD